MQNKKVLLIILPFILLSACVQQRPIESLSIIHTRGVDISEDERYNIESTLITFQFDAQTDEITTQITGKGNTIKEALGDAGYQTRYELTPGQIRLELYGKEAAQDGISQFLSTLVRDARVSDIMFFAVSDRPASEVLTKGQTQLAPNVGQYLHQLLEKEVEEDSIPMATLYDFNRKMTAIGQDPVLPVLDLDENDSPGMTGLAVFQDDKYIGKVSLKEAYLINLFEKKTKSAPLDLTLPLKPFLEHIAEGYEANDEEEMHIRLIVEHGKSNTELVDDEKLAFKTDISLEADLYEISETINVDKEAIVDLLEKESEKAIETLYDNLLTKLQEFNSDAFGLGTLYRAQKRDSELTTEEWREKFPGVTVDFHVKMDINHYGTIQ
ncbi:Ger(x)C family spore germination protein [Oceanobacillus damuensis]|uniref:Ger(x)C family spore germination protein n=1 Tax=Oceanobacillus damuensis TaxID=937928 RepID=UPI000835799D|nr:Ger(x)C family spore germination protein [Oceanobacillus damuensis]